MEFDDPIISFEILHDKVPDVRESSPEDSDQQIDQNTTSSLPPAKKKIDTRVKAISIFKPPTEKSKVSCSHDPDSTADSGGVHRIKCFQFFRKQKEQLEPDFQSSRASQHLKLWLPDDDITDSAPVQRVSLNRKGRGCNSRQFESVNDKAFTKTFYSTEIKKFRLQMCQILRPNQI